MDLDVVIARNKKPRKNYKKKMSTILALDSVSEIPNLSLGKQPQRLNISKSWTENL